MVVTNSNDKIDVKKLLLELELVKKELANIRKTGLSNSKIETIHFILNDYKLPIPTYIKTIISIAAFRNGQRLIDIVKIEKDFFVLDTNLLVGDVIIIDVIFL